MIILPTADYGEAAAFFTERSLVSQIEEIAKMLDLYIEGELFPQENKHWEAYPYALAEYGKALVTDHEIRSGELHPAMEVIEDVLTMAGDYSKPWWFGCEAVHNSYKALLARKHQSVTSYSPTDLPVLRPVIIFGCKVIVVEPEG